MVDDHRLVAVAISVALGAQGFDVQVSPSSEPPVVLEFAGRFRPRCVLLDLHLGGGQSGIDLIGPLRKLGAEIILVTSERDELVLAACLEAGVLGWVPKHADFEDIAAALGVALRGESLVGRTQSEELLARLRQYRRSLSDATSPFDRLSLREQVVLGGLMEGKTAEEIAETETVSLATVRTQVSSMLRKLGVHSQLAAVAHARRAGWHLCNETDTTVHQL